MDEQEPRLSDEPIVIPEDPPMTFSEALAHIKDGHLMARDGWNGRDMYIYLRGASVHIVPFGVEADGSFSTLRPHIVMRTAQGDFVPWVASQTDLLANDWLFAED